MMMKGNVFISVFEFYPTALSIDILILAGKLAQVHNNLFVFRSTE